MKESFKLGNKEYNFLSLQLFFKKVKGKEDTFLNLVPMTATIWRMPWDVILLIHTRFVGYHMILMKTSRLGIRILCSNSCRAMNQYMTLKNHLNSLSLSVFLYRVVLTTWLSLHDIVLIKANYYSPMLKFKKKIHFLKMAN